MPSAKGWTPQQFKDSITKVLFDNENSFYYHINKIVEEANKDFDKFEQDIKEIKSENSEFNGVKTFKGNVIFEQEVTLDYAPSSTFSAVNVGYVVNGYYNKSYIDDVVNEIKSSIETINATQNVIDIVSDKQALLSYPTANVLENDKIEVLNDDGANTIYKASVVDGTFMGWTLVGSKSPYYSKTESDAKYTTFDYLSNQLANYANINASNRFTGINYFQGGNLYIISGPNGGSLGVTSNNKLTFNSKELALKEDVGNSENLKEIEKRVSVLEYFNKGITYNDVVDSNEDLVKSVPKGASPYALLNKVGGKTLKVVQVHKISSDFSKSTSTGINLDVNVTNQTIRYYGTIQTESNYEHYGLFTATNIAKMPKGIVGHKYLIRFNVSGKQPLYSEATFGWAILKDSVSREIKDTILTCNNDSDTNMYGQVSINKGASVDFTLQPQIFDLTAMFGTGNEPTSVEEFNMYFPNEYYPYNEGEFIHSKCNNIKVIGKNLFDISKTKLVDTAYVSISNVTNNSVTITTREGHLYTGGCPTGKTIKDFCPSIQVGKTYTLNIETSSPSNRVITLLSPINGVSSQFIYKGNAFTLTEQTINWEVQLYGLSAAGGEGYGDCVVSIQIEEGTTATDITPYKESNLPINVPFDDLGKSAGNVSNYIDFENKKFVKKVGVVDLGTLNWTFDETKQYFMAKLGDNTFVKADYYKLPNFLCSKYTIINQEQIGIVTNDKSISNLSVSFIGIRDLDYNNATDFKNAVNGVLLYYESANPTEEDVSTYLPEDNYIEVEGNGNIVFENTENTAIPSEVEYQVKVGV